LAVWEKTNFVTDPLWGDNGKGKVIDLMAQRADMVIRINGGPNAGHTVRNEKGEFALHLIPSGIFNPEAVCALAGTVVVNPILLTEEIKNLRKSDIEINGNNLLISRDAHLIMPWHRTRDNLRETSRGNEKIGTTGQGIGPTYSDRSLREGLRVRDLLSPDFVEKFNKEMSYQEKLAGIMSDNTKTVYYNREKILNDLYEAREMIAPMITDVLPVIWNYHSRRKNILGEAGQGMLLDLDLGCYPGVTSSHPGIAGFNLATGIPPKDVARVIGVTKAYTTRVGEGPLPTELCDEIGEKIRKIGHEFGATTGRPRRCGWLDIPALRYGSRVGGIDTLALTKIDIFDTFSEIKICIGYEVDEVKYVTPPEASNELLAKAKPILTSLPGWEKDTSSCKTFNDLPKNAQRFVMSVQEWAGKRIELVSVGSDRQASIYT